MPVNLRQLNAGDLLPVKGIALGVTAAGIKKPGRKDLALISLAQGSSAAAVFTQNRFAAAPVVVAKRALASGAQPRALIVNAGCANAGTGDEGIARAKRTCAAAAELLDCRPEQVLPFSTGVIMEDLPVERIASGLPSCIADLSEDNWLAAATAIMTTDTQAKGASRRVTINGEIITVTGIAKGAGMIRPDMATMLAFIATDAAASQSFLDHCVRDAARRSFNRISVDGDTSTNDAFVLIATARSGASKITDFASTNGKALQTAVNEIAIELAQAIVRDGEGATKFIAITLTGGKDGVECDRAAFAVAHSPLVKTALFASDPNPGRILAAIGRAGIDDVSRVKLCLGGVRVVANGLRAAEYREEDGRRAVSGSEIAIHIDLGRGKASTTVWTCDFSYDYVRINAEYRT